MTATRFAETHHAFAVFAKSVAAALISKTAKRA
jgi:hypothetical protein